ncbi:UDP-N-acetylglucosamine 2-epimerase (non-hydrolyzing) [Vicingus serpentipes]|uniref:UDP-N-acetylglucosamine 2-epimerase (non-hydrolyzing) n=1 Tax=Vicingus serpentipes TaxID=1926625 RepID=A0A5C6RNC5_9FLAO|nr:UDP-N-acetylglucosamine 2-epimerase (non-hydrolyzing) [Vicingus serpentipes]TXB63707.1 UDP-N-acetylglucosamine 2-epimerase (non-hydrolyzing) [Vicingus serpentipes]
MSKNLLFIIGTRPELIKVFPIIQQLKKIGYPNYKIIATGQHKDLLTTYWKVFDITPDYELEIIKAGQNLTQLTSKAIVAIDDLLAKIKNEFSPDIIIAQGDTTTVMAAAMVAFYNQIKFAHIEAGLRSFNLNHPFPEEFNRKVASIVTDFHFAPTDVSKKNLIAENTTLSKIHVVGNTVIDTLHYFIHSNKLAQTEFSNIDLKKNLANIDDKLVLITCHRRENHHDLDELINAIEELSKKNADTIFIWPVHPNPNVKQRVETSNLSQLKNIIITAPLEYLDLLKVLQNCKIVISDSGGIQEEAPTFKVPVLILRETTERPEAVTLGISKLVGMNKNKIINSFNTFNPIFSQDFVNPYGDGNAAKKIVKILQG